MHSAAKNRSTGRVLPVVRRIESDLDETDLFNALDALPGRAWLDSASSGLSERADPCARALSRYSFLTADPVVRVSARPDEEFATDEGDACEAGPIAEFRRLARSLPDTYDPSLPPFQGGLLGVLGYEASRWLEPYELATCHVGQVDDVPIPAISFGVYDWTLAIDHRTGERWLICQGFDAADFAESDPDGADVASVESRLEKATSRADQICGLIAEFEAEKRIRSSFHRRVDSGESPGTPAAQPTGNPIGLGSNFSSTQFRSAVAEIVERISRGDSFQVNLAQRLTIDAELDSASLYLRLRNANPAPFAGFYDGGEFQVLSSSPEGFLQIRDRHVETRPIKGTVPRTGDVSADETLARQLLASEKDRAENIMIVDLMRNDLSRVCVDESVRVKQLCEIERYEFVQHLVSVIEGDLKAGLGASDALLACFPGGSVTGAPKIEAMKTIAELEPNPRGAYCGSMGYISCGGNADFNILIRTITAAAGRLQIPVGGGITSRSEPAAEEAETWAKAEGMLKALPNEASPYTSSHSRSNTRTATRSSSRTAHSPAANPKASEVV